MSFCTAVLRAADVLAVVAIHLMTWLWFGQAPAWQPSAMVDATSALALHAVRAK